MPKTKPSTNGRTKPAKTDDTTSSDGLDSLIGQAETLRASLREAQSHLGELIAGLRQHRKGTKSLRTALQSLRQLQTLEA